jgi:hypothetical protein
VHLNWSNNLFKIIQQKSSKPSGLTITTIILLSFVLMPLISLPNVVQAQINTLGYTSVGASVRSPEGNIRGSVWTTNETTYVSEIRGYFQAVDTWGAGNVGFAIYNATDSTILAQSANISVTTDSTGGWFNATLEYTIPSDTQVVLSAWSENLAGTLNMVFDSSTNQGRYQTLPFGAYPNPAEFITNNDKFSLYIVYDNEESEPPTPSTVIGGQFNTSVWIQPFSMNYSSATLDTCLTELRTDFGDSIEYVEARYRYSVYENVVSYNESADQGVPIGDLESFITKAKAHGYKVQIWGHSGTDTVTNSTAFFESFTPFCVDMATWAEAQGVDILTFGAENAEVLGLLNESNSTQMNTTISGMRAVYNGTISWDFNFVYTQPTFDVLYGLTWPKSLDMFEISEWHRLVGSAVNYTADDCYNGWYSAPDTPEPHWNYFEYWANLSSAYGCPVMLNLGFQSCLYSAYQPWLKPSNTMDYDAQSLAWEGTLRAMREQENETWLVGIHMEHYSAATTTLTSDFREKPAKWTIAEGLGVKNISTTPTALAGDLLFNATDEAIDYNDAWQSNWGTSQVGDTFGLFNYSAYMRFNFTGLPKNAVVDSANISIYVRDYSNFSVAINYLDVNNVPAVNIVNPVGSSVSVTSVSPSLVDSENGFWHTMDITDLMQAITTDANYTDGDFVALKFTRGTALDTQIFSWWSTVYSQQDLFSSKIIVSYTESEDTYVTVADWVSPVNGTTSNSSTIPFEISTVGSNETGITVTVTLRNSTGAQIGDNQTTLTGSFTGLTNDTYTAYVTAIGDNGASDTDQTIFTVAIPAEPIFNPSGAGPLNSAPTPTPSTTTTPTEPTQPPDTNSIILKNSPNLFIFVVAVIFILIMGLLVATKQNQKQTKNKVVWKPY